MLFLLARLAVLKALPFCGGQLAFCRVRSSVYSLHVYHVVVLYVVVSCTELIKQSLVDDSKVGEAVRPYVERNMLGRCISILIFIYTE